MCISKTFTSGDKKSPKQIHFYSLRLRSYTGERYKIYAPPGKQQQLDTARKASLKLAIQPRWLAGVTLRLLPSPNHRKRTDRRQESAPVGLKNISFCIPRHKQTDYLSRRRHFYFTVVDFIVWLTLWLWPGRQPAKKVQGSSVLGLPSDWWNLSQGANLHTSTQN